MAMKFGKIAWFKYAFGGVSLGAACLSWAASGPVRLTMSPTLNEFMTEIRYEDHEPDQPAYVSRILILGERMRMDYGQDDQGFILFDRRANTVWHVAPGEARLTGIAAGRVKDVWPKAWKLTQEKMPSEAGRMVSQVRLNGALCVEFKAAPLLPHAAGMLADFRRRLAANQANTWLGTPDDMRQPCELALDVNAAGIEYSLGLPLAVRYWDGRSRVYLSHEKRPPRPALFELPAGYSRFVIGGDQGKADSRQPRSSQAR
jgi:hypothetical protein